MFRFAIHTAGVGFSSLPSPSSLSFPLAVFCSLLLIFSLSLCLSFIFCLFIQAISKQRAPRATCFKFIRASSALRYFIQLNFSFYFLLLLRSLLSTLALLFCLLFQGNFRCFSVYLDYLLSCRQLSPAQLSLSCHQLTTLTERTLSESGEQVSLALFPLPSPFFICGSSLFSQYFLSISWFSFSFAVSLTNCADQAKGRGRETCAWL